MTDLFIPRPLEELALTWPQELDHISASSLKMAVRCPEQWRRRYVLGEIKPPAAVMIAGSADHEAVEMSMRQKIVSHVDLPIPEVQDKFIDSFETRVEEAGGQGEIEIRRGSEEVDGKAARNAVLGELKSGGVKLVGGYHKLASPHIQPIAVEEEFSLAVKGLPVKVVGFLDLVAGGTSPAIIDRKRRGGFAKKPEPEWVVAAEIYQLHRPLPHEWHVTYTKNGTYALGGGAYTLPPGPPGITETTLRHVVGEIGFFYQRYGPDEPWPARGKLHTWACGYCGYRPDCWAWRN